MEKILRLFLFAILPAPVILAMAIGNLQAQSPSPATLEKLVVYPSLIVYNGKIATMDNNLTTYQAMAIRGDRIWMLGRNQEIRELAGPQTQMIDLKGRTVVPGLIDVHTHPHLWGWWHFGGQVLADLEPVYAHGKDVEEVKLNLRAGIQRRIQTNGKDRWIIASVPHRMQGELQLFHQNDPRQVALGPDRARIRRSDLDSIASDTPVVIVSGCCRSFANSKARELMIQQMGYEATSGTRIPYDVVWGVILKGKTAEAADLVSREMQDFVNQGVTTVGGHGEVIHEVFKAWSMMDKQGKMPQRIAWSHDSGFWASKDPVEYYRYLGNFLGQGSDFLWNVGVGYEAWDNDSAGSCLSAKAKTDELQKRLQGRYPECIPSQTPHYQAHLAAVEAGLRLYDVHALTGDKVLDRAFSIAEEAIRKGSRTLEDIQAQQWNFDHAPWVRPDQVPLVKKYGFRIDFQASQFTRALYNAYNFYPQEYLSWVSPLKSFVDAGIPFAVSTDIGISKLSDDGENFLNSLSTGFPYRDSIWPHIGAWVQPVTQVSVGEFGAGPFKIEKINKTPEQRIDRISALRGMTTWAADIVLRGDRLGSLEPGKRADFVVIDKDYFTIPEPELMNIQTLMTALGGKIAYKAPNF